MNQCSAIMQCSTYMVKPHPLYYTINLTFSVTYLKRTYRKLLSFSGWQVDCNAQLLDTYVCQAEAALSTSVTKLRVECFLAYVSK